MCACGKGNFRIFPRVVVEVVAFEVALRDGWIDGRKMLIINSNCSDERMDLWLITKTTTHTHPPKQITKKKPEKL